MNSDVCFRATQRRPVIVAGVLVLFSVAACAKQAPPPASPPYVQTTVAQVGEIKPASSMAGVVAPYQNVAIQSTLTEPALSVNVQEGDFVKTGQLLAQLDTADLEAQLQSNLATADANNASAVHTAYQGGLSIAQGNQSLLGAQGALKQAQTNLQRDQRDLKRDKTLFQQGYLSQQAYQSQQATVRNDEGALQTAMSNLRSAKATVQANGQTLNAPGLQSSSVLQARAQVQVALAQADQIRVQIAKAKIVSPIDGVVVNRNLNPGEYPGSRQIFTLQQVSPIFAILRGSSDQISGVYNGAKASIDVATGGKRVALSGTVVGVLNQINPGSTQFQVKILLPNRDMQLRPGMPVQGSVTLPRVRGVRVPETAFTDDNHDALQIVQADSTLRTLKVAEIASDGTTAIVTGVRAGTRVVGNGQANLGDGEKVSYQP